MLRSLQLRSVLAGTVEQTGYGSCSGTHLHFEVKRQGVPVDPLRFLR
jgi:murein DD-endopeptidase MepM/ murein hydrolase activator NlpD